MVQFKVVNKPGKAVKKHGFGLRLPFVVGFFAATAFLTRAAMVLAKQATNTMNFDQNVCPEFRQLSEISSFHDALIDLFSITYSWPASCRGFGARLQASHMLRIEKEANGQIVLSISGQLNWDNLTELKALIASDGTGRRVVLDLRELTLVDKDAVRFLWQCESNGIELKNCPPYIGEWIARQKDRS